MADNIREPIQLLLCCWMVLSAVTPCRAEYDDMRLWHFDEDGIASVAATNLLHRKHWGFIDRSGKFVIAPRYDLAMRFENGSAYVQEGQTCVPIDRSGNILGPSRTRIEVSTAYNERRWAREAKEKAAAEKVKYQGDIWDATGKNLIARASDVKLSGFSEGLAACQIPETLLSNFDQKGAIQSTLVTSCHGYQESSAPEDRKLNRWGYVDEHGRMVIPPRFYRAQDFRDGVASVNHWASELQPNAQKSGFINKAGQLIGGRYFDTTWEFSDGFGVITKPLSGRAGHEWGFIDKSGNLIINGYVAVHQFSGGLGAVELKNGKWGFVDATGRMRISPQFDFVSDKLSEGLVAVKSSSRFGFIDEFGKYAIAPKFVDAGDFSEGLAAAATAAPEKEKLTLLDSNVEWHCGFIDTTGKQAISPRFCGARHFSQGLCAVQDGLKWGFMDTAGKIVIPPHFDYARSFSEGLAAVLINDRWGFIDKSGKFVITPTFPAYDNQDERIKPPTNFSEGFALACGHDLNWHFIDTKGLEAFPMHCAGGPSNDGIAKLFSEGLAAVDDKDFGNDGYVDHQGCLQIPHRFVKAAPFSEGLAAVYYSPKPQGTVQIPFPFNLPANNGEFQPAKYGFIDKSGQIVISPQFDYCGSFKEGLAPVGFDKPAESRTSQDSSSMRHLELGPRANWGFINRSGEVVVKPVFDEVQELSQGLAGVRLGDKWGFINATGEWVAKPVFKTVKPFSDGLAAVELNGKWGYVDRTGKFAIPAKYWVCGSFSNGRALIVIPGKAGIKASTDDRWEYPQDDFLAFRKLAQRGGGVDCEIWEGHH